jgi:hypothetical protein
MQCVDGDLVLAPAEKIFFSVVLTDTENLRWPHYCIVRLPVSLATLCHGAAAEAPRVSLTGVIRAPLFCQPWFHGWRG